MPEPEVIEGLAATLRRSGFELAPMLRQLLRSRAFYSQAAIGTQVKSPAQLILSTLSKISLPFRLPHGPGLVLSAQRQGLGWRARVDQYQYADDAL